MRTRLLASLLISVLIFAGLPLAATAEPTFADSLPAVTAPVAPSPDVAALLALINQERATAGLQALTLSTDLSRVAALHAQDMIDRSYFAHNSPLTGTPARRATAAGIKFTKLGENLCGHSSLAEGHALLMTSKLHRGNILGTSYDSVGLAVTHGGPYGLMIVEMFLQTPVTSQSSAAVVGK